jgi:hypothetical protein
LNEGRTSRWKPGDTAVLREVWRERVWTAIPATVVHDGPGEAIFYVPVGTQVKYAVDRAGRELRLYTDEWLLADHVTTRQWISFAWPDRRHAVLAFWDREWTFAGWYVNVETPLGRTEIALDYVDHCIDVLIPPDRSTWTWKDEEELEEAVRRGIWSEQQAASFRIEGERGARGILEGEPPFERDWSGWRPDPGWRVPQLPDGWERVERA